MTRTKGGSNWPFLLVVSSILGLLVGLLMMWIAWVHNAQGEIHGFGYDASLLDAARHPGRVDWGYWLLIGVLWFIVVAAPLYLATGALTLLANASPRRAPPVGPGGR